MPKTILITGGAGYLGKYTFAKVTGKPIPHEFVARRPGDVAACFADTHLALKELGWKAELDIERMCQDAWRWQSQNPNGYEG